MFVVCHRQPGFRKRLQGRVILRRGMKNPTKKDSPYVRYPYSRPISLKKSVCRPCTNRHFPHGFLFRKVTHILLPYYHSRLCMPPSSTFNHMIIYYNLSLRLIEVLKLF